MRDAEHFHGERRKSKIDVGGISFYLYSSISSIFAKYSPSRVSFLELNFHASNEGLVERLNKLFDLDDLNRGKVAFAVYVLCSSYMLSRFFR